VTRKTLLKTYSRMVRSLSRHLEFVLRTGFGGPDYLRELSEKLSSILRHYMRVIVSRRNPALRMSPAEMLEELRRLRKDYEKASNAVKKARKRTGSLPRGMGHLVKDVKKMEAIHRESVRETDESISRMYELIEGI